MPTSIQLAWTALCCSVLFNLSPAYAQPSDRSSGTWYHHPIATESAEAQDAFNQGLHLVFAFDYDEAIRSFIHASQLDPEASMPHWGIALALGPSLNNPSMGGRMMIAHAAAERALELADDETEKDRAYARALLNRYSSAPQYDLVSLNAAYVKAMRGVVAKYPTDVDAATLLADALTVLETEPFWDDNGQPSRGTAEAIPVLEAALDLAPSHAGANHFYIHLMEHSPTPELALPSAQRLQAGGWENGHLLHMPAHVYVRLGDFRSAVASSLRAVAADRLRPDSEGPVGGYSLMQVHARAFLAAAASMTGQFKVAREQTANLFVLLRFNRWAEILEVSAPDDPVASIEWHVARVLALARLGRLREAELALEEYSRAESTVPRGARWWLDPIERFLPLARHEMNARLAWARGRHTEAITHWREAVVAQDQLTPGEIPPWPWYHPTRESLGAALYLTGQYVAAERVFRDDLESTRGNARSLFGLWQTLDAKGEVTQALRVQRLFEAAWADADVDLSMPGL